MDSDETIMVDHRIIFRVVPLMVGTLVEPSDLKETCQDMEEVEVDLIKAQMLAGREL